MCFEDLDISLGVEAQMSSSCETEYILLPSIVQFVSLIWGSFYGNYYIFMLHATWNDIFMSWAVI